MFEQSMGHIAPPTHCLSPVADHSTRPISLRHGAPPCCHPSRSTTLGQAEELHRRALTGQEDQLGPCIRTPSAPCGIWRFFWRTKAPLQRRGESRSAGVAAWGGSDWRGCQGGKLVEVEEDKKWFNSDAFLKGDLTSLGKSVVKIRKMMFYSAFFL